MRYIRSMSCLLAEIIPICTFTLVASTFMAEPNSSATVEPISEPTRLETATGVLHGSLLLSPNPGPHHAVLIIAGSGPTDRDGNSALLPGNNNSLKLLAEEFETAI